MLNTIYKAIMVNFINNQNICSDFKSSFYVWDKYFGINFAPDGSIIIKIFAFPYLENIHLEIKRIGKDIEKFKMEKGCDCIWKYILPKDYLQNGDRYRFVLDFCGTNVYVKDPCSMWQDVYFKWSKFYNHTLFKWNDLNWLNGDDKRKISRIADENNKLKSVDDLRIYELHLGTFTNEGTYLSAKEGLKRLVDIGFNAIEIMPVENTYSFNWGYDGVDKYAPNHTYGTPDELKELIDYAHSIGLNVIMDFVPNHLGPDIAQLQLTGPYLDGENCFGFKFNFEKDEYRFYTRDYITGTALNWILNYHCDGLRADMTKFMCSDYTMKQIAAEINYYAPNAFLIAEDGRDNDSRVTKTFSLSEIEENENDHDGFINKIRNNDISLSALGFDTEWDFPFHKQIASSVLGSWDCRNKDINNFDSSLSAAQSRVKYPMSHDEIGNIDGTRLITKIVARELNLSSYICDCEHGEECKIAAHATQSILTELVSGRLEKYSAIQRKLFYFHNNLNVDIPVEQIYSAYKKAVQLHKLAIAKIYSIPGPKMIFQGDENANLAYFKFFRKFSIGSEPYLLEKGYKPGISAFHDSKLASVYVDKEYQYINKTVEHFMTDLNNLCENNPSISSGHIEKTIVHQNSDIHAIHAKKNNNEIFSVSNFSNVSYMKNYGILFPKGEWREIINSDKQEYFGENIYLNTDSIFKQFSYISIPAYGIIFFEKEG